MNKEMDLKSAEGKGSSPRREFKLFRARNQKVGRNSLLEAIAQVNGGSVVSRVIDEGGLMKMKMVVKKQDLKQMLELLKGGNNSNASPCMSLEQRLILMRKRQVLRENQGKRSSLRSSWKPVLQSIPEELL